VERRAPVRVRPQGDWWSDSDATPSVSSHPRIHALTGIDHREYYIQNTAETLWRDAMDA
jgi:hypothetical protein